MLGQPSVKLPAELGKYLSRDSELFCRYGWRGLVRRRRSRSNLTATVGTVPHNAARFLDKVRRHGYPVMLSTPPWPSATLDAAVRRGPHPSAVQHCEFLYEDMVDLVRKGHWILLPYRLAKRLPSLRLTPPGVIPQRGRRPRTIVDYTWSGINEATLTPAPYEAMRFGRELNRYLWHVYWANPKHGLVYQLKKDLADGFYLADLSVMDAPKMAVPLPRVPGLEQLVAIPLGLPMGWILAPPVFCAGSETALDLAKDLLPSSSSLPPHPLEELAATPPPPAGSRPPPMPLRRRPRLAPRPGRYHRPLAYFGLYMDDFLAAAQGSPRRLTQIRRALLHAIDQVFRPNDAQDTDRREPVSVKKLLQGDGCWSTLKTILGWIVDTLAGTVSLPPHRSDRLHQLLSTYPRHRKRVSAAEWHKLVGELRSMALGLPGASSCFSFLQHAFKSGKLRLRLNTAIHDQLDDFRWLAKEVTSRPTRIAEIVPDEADYVGTYDAAKPGAGGVWLPHDSWALPPTPAAKPALPLAHPPLLWRMSYPRSIQREVVSFDNPRGTITNSDLETSAGVLGKDVLAQEVDLTEANVESGGDNTPATSRLTKQSHTTDGPSGYLMRLSGVHRRHYRYQDRWFYLPGPINVMADDASRLWHLSDTELLSHFNTQYPQSVPWRLCQVRSAMRSAVISSLQSKRASLEVTLPELKRGTLRGKSGSSSATSTTWTSSWRTSPTKSQSFKCLPYDTETDVLRPVTTRAELERWRTWRARLGVRFNTWAPTTSVLMKRESWTGGSRTNGGSGSRRILRLGG